jgi:hypothetical protein
VWKFIPPTHFCNCDGLQVVRASVNCLSCKQPRDLGRRPCRATCRDPHASGIVINGVQIRTMHPPRCFLRGRTLVRWAGSSSGRDQRGAVYFPGSIVALKSRTRSSVTFDQCHCIYLSQPDSVLDAVTTASGSASTGPRAPRREADCHDRSKSAVPHQQALASDSCSTMAVSCKRWTIPLTKGIHIEYRP